MADALRIAITGAGGFIGGRTAEYLLGQGYQVRALIHHYQSAARLSIWPIEFSPADVLDEPSLERALQGIDVVIHCAYGNTADSGLNERITLEGTQNVTRAATAAHVRRLVHLSTVSVYGSPLPSRIDESTPYGSSADWYGRSKQQAEEAALAAHASGDIDVVVLQPAIVYGPWAGVWTIAPVQRIKDESLYLYDDGRGVCNTLYIDNLAEAIRFACITPGAGGERFLISDGEPVTWREFFGYYAQMVGKPLKSASGEQVKQLESRRGRWTPVVRAVKVTGKTGATVFSAVGLRAIAESGKKTFKRQTRWINETSLSEMEFYSGRTVFDISHGKERLGYSPHYRLAQGMARTEAWLRFARMIP